MKASLRSVRIAPKKASLVAKMIRGLPVPEALTSLERTNKKAARILEDLIRSAIANAQHNDKQDPDALVIKTLIVNQAQAYHRGVPMARGRVRPLRKFLSHIHVTLGVAPTSVPSSAKATEGKKASAGKQEKELKEVKESKETKEKKPAAAKKTAKAASQTAEKAVKKKVPEEVKKPTSKKEATPKKGSEPSQSSLSS